jgi:hypothetical protein
MNSNMGFQCTFLAEWFLTSPTNILPNPEMHGIDVALQIRFVPE